MPITTYRVCNVLGKTTFFKKCIRLLRPESYPSGRRDSWPNAVSKFD